MSQQTRSDIKVFKRLLVFAKDYKRYLLLTLLFTIVLGAISPVRPMLIGEVVNRFIVDSQDQSALTKWCILLVGISLSEGVFQFLNSYYSNLMAQSVIRDIRQRLYAHLIKFKSQFFDKTPIGNLVTRLVSDIEAISDVFSSGLIDIVGDLLLLIVVIILMFISNWQLSLLSLIPIPLLLIATRVFARAMRRSFQQERQQVTRLNTFIQEHLSGMSIVQLFNREKQEYDKFKGINADHRQAHINAVWAFSIFFPVVEFLSSLSIAFVLVWGGLYTMGNTDISSDMFGEIFTFTLWISMLFRPIRQLADKFNILQRGVVRAERVFEILDMNEDVQAEGKDKSVDFNQNLRFEHVYFAYKGEEWILKDINLEIPAGKMVAFVGATGAGKSTIVNLLARFYEFQKGDIKIGDTSIKDIELSYLRKNIAIVLQDVFLFSDTVLNNITLGNPEITREEVIEAAKAVGAHDFIMKLPGNYDYQIGERGGVLSVGQRQLISFIRAFVYKPTILILDEATSSVDSESEHLIQKATDKLTQGRTAIVIAHRLSTIQKADMIVVLDQGEIKEIGSHYELLELNGFYKNLYDIQFSEN
ncbi:MAG: ABC transporter ATP-binding protein [Flavobacteriia bacterium]|nr:ABC transporter ATP-binding protein [Flavobacteriia bacterium]OJX36088.1 MAG: antibiotic ABC transporter ATP-binding protein [Flavobacteriia bacterium 40-80]